MTRITRLVILGILLGLVAASVHWLFPTVSLEATVALVALIETAAVITEAHSFSKVRKPKIILTYSWYGMHKLKYDAWEFTFKAQVTNVGDLDDVLERIDHCFYNRRFGIIRSSMVSGAALQGDIKTGHILPYLIPPKHNVEIQSKGSFSMPDFPYDHEKDHVCVLSCNFILSNSKGFRIRITQNGGTLTPWENLWLSMKELFFRCKPV